jgi:hypothetical protein
METSAAGSIGMSSPRAKSQLRLNCTYIDSTPSFPSESVLLVEINSTYQFVTLVPQTLPNPFKKYFLCNCSLPINSH